MSSAAPVPGPVAGTQRIAERASDPVERQAQYFPAGDAFLFGWTHHAPGATPLDCVAVLCSALGYEYAHSHRAMRHLADRLAARGIPALRFDYHGIGDSPGGDLDPARWSRWQSDVRSAIAFARAWSGRRRVCLVGVRLGAALAALAAREGDVDLLVLWNPVASGRHYVREMRAIAATARGAAANPEGPLESGGFVLSPETIADVQGVNLLQEPLRAGAALVVARDDLAPDPALPEHLRSRGIAVDEVVRPGYGSMMREAQFTEMPDEAFEAIVGWVASHSSPQPADTVAASPAARQEMQLVHRGPDGVAHAMEESIARFGQGGRLFGILTRSGEAATGRPVAVLFNAGCVHHVGPNRVYVAIARHLARLGIDSLRFDLEGIGDSILRGPGRENHPYPDHAPRDAQAALDHLEKALGYGEFIPLGLCSGAHTAFHVALDDPRPGIREAVLVNPLTFYWKEGMTLATPNHMWDVPGYRRSMRSPASWVKLFSGKVDLLHLASVARTYIAAVAKSYYYVLTELVTRAGATALSRDLRRLFAMGRSVTFVISEGDPGHDILMASARRSAHLGMRSGWIRMQMIPEADHTFSRSQPRAELLSRLGTFLNARRPGRREQR